MTVPIKYKGKGTYGVLTESEQAYWNEYTNLRQISDWPGFDKNQDLRRQAARAWILDRMDYIDALASGEFIGQPKGWDASNRGERYDFLSTLNSGEPKHEVRLPCSGLATDAEKAYIEEREVYLYIDTADDIQRDRKLANVAWLKEQRAKLWHLMQDDPKGNKPNDRQTRYQNLCIATSYGDAYKEWDDTHNEYGEPYTEPDQRKAIAKWLDSYVGTVEKPKGTNKGEPQPSGWERRVYGTDGVPWCACFAVCSAWDNGIDGTGTASVGINTALAKQGKGIYRGWTSDPSKVQVGDHCFIGDDHTGVARGTLQANGSIRTVEGNTSGTTDNGSQWNGDLVGDHQRPAGYWTAGFGLVRAD